MDPVSTIFDDGNNYLEKRQQQPHFIKENTKFHEKCSNYMRLMYRIYFLNENYEMYLPTLFNKDDIFYTAIGEWYFEDNEWNFYFIPYAKFDNKSEDLSNLIIEGTKLLNAQEYLPDKYSWSF